MSSPFQTKAFKALQTEWYQRLESEGFDDIEDTSSRHEFLKEWHSGKFQSARATQRFIENDEYYRLASQFLNEHRIEPQFEGNLIFATHLEEKIWRLHTEGIPIRKIESLLSGQSYRRHIHETIIRLKKIMLGV